MIGTPDGPQREQRLHLDAIDGLARATHAPRETLTALYEAALADLRLRARIKAWGGRVGDAVTFTDLLGKRRALEVAAPQVLENLLKRGIPTRAKCVMLNKGAHLAEALVLRALHW